MGMRKQAVATIVVLVAVMATSSNGAIPRRIGRIISMVNMKGPYLGVVVPNSYEMSPLLKSSSFVSRPDLAFLDFAGRRFRFGMIGKVKVIVVMTGLSMLNAGITTQLLLSLFEVKGVLHYGIAGNANPDLQIGDVTIPQYWAHTSLWNWQRYGDGINDELALEVNGDYTRTIGNLNFSDFGVYGKPGNSLNSVWYQPEEIFPVNGVPEVRQHAFWVSVNKKYYELAEKLEGMELPQCINSTTCLKRKPMVVRVTRGCSANTFVDNAAYRKFLRAKFDVTPVEMESAAIALVCLQQQVPFITIRSLSDLAGGGSSQSNEADVFGDLAAENAVRAAIAFTSLLS